MRHYLWIFLLGTSALALGGCSSMIERVERTSIAPPLTKVDNPQTAPEYKPLSWPLPDPEASSIRTANSLWQPGARGFFRDQRATRVGDILKVNVSITDQAKLDNTNNTQRTTADTSTAPKIFG